MASSWAPKSASSRTLRSRDPWLLRKLGVGPSYYGSDHLKSVAKSSFWTCPSTTTGYVFFLIDLKIGEFKAEFAGKISLCLNTVDGQLRHTDDA